MFVTTFFFFLVLLLLLLLLLAAAASRSALDGVFRGGNESLARCVVFHNSVASSALLSRDVALIFIVIARRDHDDAD